MSDFDAVFLNRRVIQKEGLYVYNMQNIADKHFSIGIAPVRVGSLVLNMMVIFRDKFLLFTKKNKKKDNYITSPIYL
jgi:hypothetical protein